jgi:hypothetical protein
MLTMLFIRYVQLTEVMTNRQTAKIANSDLIEGNKLYQERARITLPYLVRQAKAGQTIYYSDLAEEVGISNPRNLNYVLGSIGNAMIELGKRTRMEIPLIQCLVVNKRQQLPGEGIGWFISPTDFSKLNITQKRKVVAAQLTKIYLFQRWDWVLQQLDLVPVPTNLNEEIETAKNRRGGGESEQHKKFKEFISKNPHVIGLNTDLANGIQEYTLPSADAVDVLFTDDGLKIGVEVKSYISDTADILLGLFQCVKYKHLIEAEQTICDEVQNSRIILALQGQFPVELILVKNLLGIEVIDNISINDKYFS